jgi:hypothetical protein
MLAVVLCGYSKIREKFDELKKKLMPQASNSKL